MQPEFAALVRSLAILSRKEVRSRKGWTAVGLFAVAAFRMIVHCGAE